MEPGLVHSFHGSQRRWVLVDKVDIADVEEGLRFRFNSFSHAVVTADRLRLGLLSLDVHIVLARVIQHDLEASCAHRHLNS